MKTKTSEVLLKDVLFEIGTEELPATNLADIFENPEKTGNILEAKAKEAFNAKRLPFENCRVWATPRRILFWFEGVVSSQSPKDQMIRLLSKGEAYFADGSATEKLLMILKHKNASIQETVLSDSNGKTYVFIKKTEPQQKAVSVLPEIFESLVKSLPFPKNMKWDDSNIYFPRPIRSLLYFYGDRSVSFKIGRTAVKNETTIFLKAKRERFLVKDIPSYFKILQKKGVLLNPADRKKAIQEELRRLAGLYHARLHEDPFLLNEVNYLVENPHSLSAVFDEKFLKLPFEVLTVSMARKQRIFCVLDKEGKVSPRFLAILDGPAKEKDKKIISKNMENILHAKLQDSLFFYQEDIKLPLEKKREELKSLIFLKNAGSMLEKSDRLVSLAKKMGKELDWPKEDQAVLERAAFLAKADLLTQMVGEFPELQGIMGKYYALESGESQATAEAIGEQYLPRTAQDKLPETLAGGLLSILDKADLVTACFGQGIEPSSSLDPYGLRRNATSVLKIILHQKIPLSIKKLLSQTQIELGSYVQKPRAEALFLKLEAFFKDRFNALMTDKGFRGDLVEGVLASNFEHPYEAYSRIQALSRFLGEERFTKAWKVVERTVNILKSNKEPLPNTINPSLFAEDLEKQVFKHYEDSHRSIREATESCNYQAATNLYAEAFFDILDEFFEKVFVNAEDLNVRRNRLALLRAIKELYTERIADLSKVHLSAFAENTGHGRGEKNEIS